MFRSPTYLLAVAVLCAGCGKPRPSDPAAWGKEIYARTLCGQCHGADQRGTIQGPPLENLQEHWTTEELTAYLAAPMNYVDTQPRLRALADHYKMLMPAMPLTDEERNAVAAFLLQDPSTAPSTNTSAPSPPSKGVPESSEAGDVASSRHVITPHPFSTSKDHPAPSPPSKGAPEPARAKLLSEAGSSEVGDVAASGHAITPDTTITTGDPT